MTDAKIDELLIRCEVAAKVTDARTRVGWRDEPTTEDLVAIDAVIKLGAAHVAIVEALLALREARALLRVVRGHCALPPSHPEHHDDDDVWGRIDAFLAARIDAALGPKETP